MRFLPIVLLAVSPQFTAAASVDAPATFAALKGTSAKYTVHAPQKAPNKQGCGMPNGVTMTKGPSGIVYSPALEIDAALAKELIDVEKILQEEAKALLGTEIKRIDTLGSYACRKSNGVWTKGQMSEHAFGLAFDLKSMTTKKGKVITVLKDWGKDTPEGKLLVTFRRRILKETGITHVITPDYNAMHRDHLHIDRGLPFGWWMTN